MSKKVFVGLSGGVDSSVTALLLKSQGYDVTGVYMKNWSQDLPGFECPWKQDYNDAKRVAVQLNIPFKMYDFENKYREKVVDYMVDEYKAGRTPNPDVMCNQEIKFKLFYQTAIEDGADYVATGHYAVTHDSKMFIAEDENKDQTYFLYRVESSVLSRVLFPLGEYKKTKVKEIAEKEGLITASKKESMGICFVGKVGIREFLVNELGIQPKGRVVNQHREVIGEHDGTIYYTIGQRKGLHIGGGLPYYVVGKDMDKNIVYVTTDINDDNLWSKHINMTDTHWINDKPKNGLTVRVRTRHRAPLVTATLKKSEDDYSLGLEDPIRALTPGQSVVLYEKNKVLGGGIII